MPVNLTLPPQNSGQRNRELDQVGKFTIEEICEILQRKEPANETLRNLSLKLSPYYTVPNLEKLLEQEERRAGGVN